MVVAATDENGLFDAPHDPALVELIERGIVAVGEALGNSWAEPGKIVI